MSSTIHQLTQGVLDVGAMSECGRRRQHNQDFYLIDDDMLVYAVADGIGGHVGGDIASHIACEQIIDLLGASLDNIRRNDTADCDEAIRHAIIRSFQSADRRIVCEQSLDPRYAQMGTTAVVAHVAVGRDDSFAVTRQLYIGHAGDSRALLVRDGRATQLTTSHTLATGLLEAGVITQEQALRHPGRHTLYLFLGGELHDAPELVSCPVVAADRIVLLTDGITGVLDNQQVAKLVDGIFDSEIAAACLVDEAISRGATDDVTAIVIRVCDTPL